MPNSLFSAVETAPVDPILGITESFRADSNPRKVNLTIGVYQNDKGVNPVMSSVKQAEKRWLEEETTKAYLGMAGEPRFGELVRELLLGPENAVEAAKRAVTVQAPGGTGALRVAADFIHTQLPGRGLWISDPTWPNHNGILGSAGLTVKTYPYYDPAAHGMRFDDMRAALEQVPGGDVVLLHACCHNPTGVDPTAAQWAQLAELFQRRALVPFFDFAYQGLADGLDEDARGVRIFAEQGLEMLIANSFSKNFGLYRERVGSLTAVARDTATAERVLSRLKLTVRSNFSNPPAHGGKIVEIVLTTPELRQLWMRELTEVRERIAAMRRLFVETMAKLDVRRNFGFLLAQKGMFSFSGIGREEVLRLRKDYGVYMVENGRINVAAMTTGNMDYLCKSIAAVIGK
ncbi:MAG: aspartate/tyrosine/aromatic aminotransferase [Candidatus Lambdaproteobacteria bacterium]|nr:aspartate/tyrosine/aromatic aminotransferase [Candidatus Lambdaproteobacteria bacterium]